MILPTMKILYGPPGTGKTWMAAREATLAVEPGKFLAASASENPDKELQALHHSLVQEGRIVWLTFHPGYSYEDFMEGYRPSLSEAGQLVYTIKDGPFKEVCSRARHFNDLYVGEVLRDGNGKPSMEVVSITSAGWVIRTTTGRQNAVAPSTEKFVPRSVVNSLMDKGFSPNIFSVPGSGLKELSKFGLSSDDSDVGPPEQDETETSRLGSTIRKILAARTGILSSSDLTNGGHYGAVLRRLIELEQDGEKLGKPVAIVIDEINRADPSRVFGELLTLLEVDKREGMPEERKLWLPYSKELFSVPLSVSVIGTMNTVDRSLVALDFAMRRRFEFVLVPPNVELVPALYGGLDLRQLLGRINSRIAVLLGDAYSFGHSFFLRERLESVRAAMGWNSDKEGDMRILAFIIRTSILPTLAEYFHDDWNKVKAVIGLSKNQEKEFCLFDLPPVDSVFLDRMQEDYDFSGQNSLLMAAWWDPANEEWNGGKFFNYCLSLSEGR